MYRISRTAWLLAFGFYVLYAILAPSKALHYDVICWANWADWIRQHPLGQAYGSTTNYLPGHLYELKLFGYFFHSTEAVHAHIHYLKYFTLLFDIGGALLVCSLVKNTGRQVVAFLAIMLNLAYLHNNLLWGQFDSVFTTLVFGAFLAAFQKRALLSALLFLLALNFKLQAIILLPALGLYLLYQSQWQFRWIRIFSGMAVLLLVEMIILFPFFMEGQAKMVWQTAKGLGGNFGQVSLNAANLWQLLIPGGDLRWMSDAMIELGWSLKRWGLILVGATYFIALYPLLKSLRPWKREEMPLQKLFLVCALSVLVFFFFNTQMHERYSFPAFLFLAGYAVVTGRWWIYGLFSVAYYLNNEKCLHSIKTFDVEAFPFDYPFIAVLFLVTIILVGVDLFRPVIRTKEL